MLGFSCFAHGSLGFSLFVLPLGPPSRPAPFCSPFQLKGSLSAYLGCRLLDFEGLLSYFQPVWDSKAWVLAFHTVTSTVMLLLLFVLLNFRSDGKICTHGDLFGFNILSFSCVSSPRHLGLLYAHSSAFVCGLCFSVSAFSFLFSFLQHDLAVFFWPFCVGVWKAWRCWRLRSVSALDLCLHVSWIRIILRITFLLLSFQEGGSLFFCQKWAHVWFLRSLLNEPGLPLGLDLVY